MSKTIQVTLNDELSEAVADAVARGQFKSEAEAICGAVADWRARTVIEEIGVDELRRLWDEGVASGPGEGLSSDDIKARGRARLALAK